MKLTGTQLVLVSAASRREEGAISLRDLKGRRNQQISRMPGWRQIEEVPVDAARCPACGRETREIDDVSDAIIPIAIQRDIEVFYVQDDPEFDRAGNIAALLRFRADQSKGQLLQAAS